ncbi:MAG: dockerin type I domain-containing protein [Planctomycetaceae bacterium]|nr:dockerin type I domain-containing protein [Planctomycetaceae bacterium]
MNPFTRLSSLAALAAACLSAPALAQSDDCATPTPIQGAVVMPFDLGTATQSFQGNVLNCLGGSGFGTMGRDVWFCWTADCDGIVRISTCGLTQGDTILAIYPETLPCGACPGDLPPLCCSDDACGKQSEITCEVRCGMRYLIQVGTRPNDPGFPGSVSIACEGKPCGGGGGGSDLTPPECGDCCGARPPLVDTLPTPFTPGQVAVATEFADFGAGPAVVLVDLGDQSLAPIGGPPVSNWNTQRYTHPSWSVANLGSVFGTTFDGSGNIFVAHTAIYPNWYAFPDPLGTGGAGAIYRLDGVTGAISVFKNLPQSIDPALPATAPHPGLGQLDFDCSRNVLIASNFEDGRIYSIHATSGTVYAFDHATGVATNALAGNGNQLAETGDQPGAAPRGERVWAVKVAGDRVYYSIWSQDESTSGMAPPNTIHSVQIDANGKFVAGTSRLELTVPAASFGYSNPVADISFDDQCCMLVAERTMVSVTDTGAHRSRTLRFCFDTAANAWAPPASYATGVPGFSENTAGGVDFVLGANGPQVWSIADAIQLAYPVIYGLTSAPVAGVGTIDAPNVDLDGNLSQQQKYQLGSLDITCWGAAAPCEFETKSIKCDPNDDGTMDFLWEVTITNNSNVPANLLILPDAAFAPNHVVVLNPPLGVGASTTLVIPINGGTPGTQFCFSATLAGSTGDECCTTEICIELPDCQCFEYDLEIKDLPGNGSFTFQLDITNLELWNAEWITIAVDPSYPGTTVNPSLINIPTLNFASSLALAPVTVTTGLPAGSTIIVIVGMHSATFHPCCFKEITLTVPANTQTTLPGDLDADGMVGASDLAAMLNAWGMPGATDLNGDGVTNAADLTVLLMNWS